MQLAGFVRTAQPPAAAPQTVVASPIQPPSTIQGVPVVRLEKEAPCNERKVTDGRALLVFVGYLGVAGYVAFLAFLYGSSGRLNHAVNYHGGVCGVSPGLTQYPYLYYPLDPASSQQHLLASARKCVQTCPTADDVNANKVVPILRSQVERSPKGTSAVLLEYTVNSPVYASTPFAGRLCIPSDPSLAAVLGRILLGEPLCMFREHVGSIAMAKGPLFVSVVIAWALSGLASFSIKSFPRLVIPLAIVAAMSASLCFGVIVLFAGTTTPAEVARRHTAAAITSPLETIGSFLVGLCLLGCGVAGLPLLLYMRREALRAATRVLEATSDIVWARGPVGSPLLLSTLTFIFGWFWLGVLFLLCGSSTSSWTPVPLSLSRNGGVEFLPIDRTDRLPLWVAVALLAWGAAGFWVAEYLLAAAKFAAAYAGTMWYFTTNAPLQGNGAAALSPFQPGCVASWIALVNHAGSLAIAGLGYGLSRPCRTVASWIRPRYLTWGYESVLRQGFDRLTDILSTGGFVEMAVASTSLRTSMRTSAKRTARRDSVTCRLLDTAGLGTALTTLSIVLVSGLMIYSVLVRNHDYSQPSSTSYVPAPLFVTLVQMTFAAAVIAPVLDSWGVLSDALLYCYVMEGGDEDAEVTNDDPTYKVHAPLPLRDLISEELGGP